MSLISPGANVRRPSASLDDQSEHNSTTRTGHCSFKIYSESHSLQDRTSRCLSGVCIEAIGCRMVQSTVTPPALLTKKKTIARPPTYHESPAFLRKESAFDVALGSCSSGSSSHDKSNNQQQPPWFLGQGVSESHRLVATVARAVERASLLTRPFSWGYGWKDGALAHNNTQHVAGVKAIAFFRHEIVRSVSAGNRLSLFLTGLMTSIHDLS